MPQIHRLIQFPQIYSQNILMFEMGNLSYTPENLIQN